MSHGWLRGRLVVLAAVAVVLLAVHGIVLRYVSSSLALPTAAVLGVVALVLLKHLGILGPLFAVARNREPSKRPRHERREPQE